MADCGGCAGPLVARRIEQGTDMASLRTLARGTPNPARGFASLLRGKTPWYRDDRGRGLDALPESCRNYHHCAPPGIAWEKRSGDYPGLSNSAAEYNLSGDFRPLDILDLLLVPQR